jgi:putative DNA primase/helicase
VSERLRIDVTASLSVKVEALIGALARGNDEREPKVMVMGTELVRMAERGALEPFDVDSASDHSSKVADFGSWGRGEEWRAKDPPANVVKALLARDSSEYPGLPRVERVVDVPVLTAAGDLLTEPGLDAASRIYYRPAEGLEGVAPPDEIGVEEVEEAREFILREYLGDFDFEDAASRCHALALTVLPFVREHVDGPTPMHGVFAADMGAGKTTLVQACLIPGCGLVGSNSGAAGNDEEWRKVITSALLSGQGALVFDNVHGTLDSAALASALTTGVWSDRVLGSNRMATLPVRNVWAATGNNASMTPEQVRRTIPIFLDPGDKLRASDRPADSFRHEDPLGWGLGNRRELVRAALTLVEHWRRGPATVEGGYVYLRTGEEPRRSRKTLGSFRNWAAVVGGVMEAVGMRDFLGNRDKLDARANEQRMDAEEFLAAWHGHSPAPVAFRDLRPLCELDGPLAGCLPAEVMEAGPGKLEGALAKWLKKNRDSRVGAYKLVRVGMTGSGLRYGWQVSKRSA